MKNKGYNGLYSLIRNRTGLILIMFIMGSMHLVSEQSVMNGNLVKK